MKSLIYSLLAFTAMGFLFSCQGSKASQGGEIVIPDKLEKSLLWEITGKGIKKPSYLFGTIHMISEKDFKLSDAAKQAIEKSDKMVMEIDMSKMMATSIKMLSMAPMKEGKKLSDLISEEDYNTVKTYFTEEAESPELKVMPFSMIESWKPMLLQSFLYTDMIEGPVKAYEMELMTIGKKADMEFGGLETIEDQINVFEKIPYEDQAKALVESVKQIKNGDETGKNEFIKLVEAYKSEDVDGMIEMSGEQMDEMENGEEELLIKRNTKWIPLIIEMAKEQPTFFAVGAAHLGGPHGVIRLLMKEGYQVKPIKGE